MFTKFQQKMMVLAAFATVAALLSSACTVAPIQQPTPAAQPAADATGIGDNMRGLLARQLQVDPAAVEVAVVEPAEWPDACLGAGTPAEACAQVVTPGYIVTLRVDGREYTYHTDPEGYQLRLVAAPETAIAAPLITWIGAVDNASCQDALIGAEGVAFGLCGSATKLDGKFVSAARQDVLAEWAEQFASFTAATDLGQVTFAGSGAAVATPAEQQQIAQWARTVVMEAAGGESLAGLRYEGPAEIGSTDTSKCAVLQLGPSIEAGIGACDGTMTNKDMGNGTYLDWEYLRDHFAPFVYETDTERITFEGMGSSRGDAWQRAILAWARMRYAELSSGKVSAAAGTILSWRLGPNPEQPETCRHLTVLAYGYAQAETRPCAGGEVLESSNGWLQTAELEQLDPWVYERAALYAGDNYVAGVGSQPMSDAEAAAAEQWAAEVWNRLAGDGAVMSPTP
jgi:hypothetical protein